MNYKNFRDRRENFPPVNPVDYSRPFEIIEDSMDEESGIIISKFVEPVGADPVRRHYNMFSVDTLKVTGNTSALASRKPLPNSLIDATDMIPTDFQNPLTD